MLTNKEKEYYRQQLPLNLLNEKNQILLKKAKVLVVGAGGLGCPVLTHLAGAGIGKLGIVDWDKIQFSNLHRQFLYKTDDVNSSKVEIAKKYLTDRNPWISVKSYQERLTEKNIDKIIQEYDIVVDCSDNFGTRYLINDYTIKHGIPMIYGAISKMEGCVSVFNGKNNNKPQISFRDLYPNPSSLESIPGCGQIGVLGAVTAIIGSIQAIETIKLIIGNESTLSGKLFRIDTLTMETQILKINPSIIKPKVYSKDYEIGCSDPKVHNMEISPIELHKLICSGKDVQLIDVRGVPGLDGITAFDEIISPIDLDTNIHKIYSDKMVVLYCNHGIQSKMILQTLIGNYGFKNVHHLLGGIKAWFEFLDNSCESCS